MLSSLRLVRAATVEPIDMRAAIEHCRIDGADDGRMLAGTIAAARQWAEGWLGRSLTPQGFAWTLADISTAPTPMMRFAPTPSPGTLLIPSITAPWPPRRPLEFPRAPVTEVESVTVGGFGIEDVTLTADDYDLDLATDPARILLRPSAAVAKAERMTITFTAGYATPADVPMPIRQAMLLIIGHLWEHRGDAGGELPPVARQLMNLWRITGFA